MNLNIYLIRHGDAEAVSKTLKDFDRSLTPEGVRKMREAVSKWKTFIPQFDFIISSPYARALQTAHIIAEVFDCTDKLMIDKRVGCGSKSSDIVEMANALDGKNIAFVGHQPDMSEHIASFISNNNAFAEFKKGGIAKVCFHNRAREGKGILEYLIPPGCLIKD